MKRKKNRIGRKLISVLFLFVLVIILLLLTGSYIFHSREVDNLYEDRIDRVTRAISTLVDGDFVARLADTIYSEEFQKVHEKALQNNDESLLVDYLKEKDLYTDYERYTGILQRMLASMGVEDIYVLDLNGDGDISFLNPSETISELGVPKGESSLQGITSNIEILPTIDKKQEGWQCYGTKPIQDSEGNIVAVAGADLNMNEDFNRRHSFLIIMIMQSLVILVAAAIAGALYIKKVVSDPLSNLAQDTAIFGASDEDDLASEVVQIPGPRDDEIGDLYQDIQSMQLGIIRYMENLKSVTSEQERLETELNIANRIQASMLPNSFPAFPDRNEFDIYALMKPAKSVAGDFYDFFLIDDDHLAIVIADVSGKGIPAALFMMMSKSVISNIAKQNVSPDKILERANERICVHNDENMFVTVWLGILTISTGHIVAANAGHEFPALQKEDGTFELFHDRHGFVIGGMAGVHYKNYEFDLQKDQILFLYTDGVPDATTQEGERFGTERMVESLNNHPDPNPRDLVHYMLRTVDDFDGDVPQFDDITMLALRYNGPDNAEESDSAHIGQNIALDQ